MPSVRYIAAHTVQSALIIYTYSIDLFMPLQQTQTNVCVNLLNPVI
jgi:hypothetical protein